MSSDSHYHNKGEKDRAERRGYNLPNNFLGGILNDKKQIKENKAYAAGWRNTNKQKKYK